MSLNQIRKVLSEVVGCRAATIVAVTVPKLKGGSPFKGRKLEKRSEVNGMINWHYENAVNNQRERENKEADFEAKPRQWGTRVRLANRLLPFVAKEIAKSEVTPEELANIPTNELYLEFKVQQSLRTEYYVDGILATKEQEEEIKKWLRPISPSRQEVKKEVILRDYALSNINSVTINGKTYYK